MTAERYEAQVRAALRAVALRAPDAFLWFGCRETVSAAGDGDPRDRLVAALAQRLHDDFFSTAAPRPHGGDQLAAPDDGGAFVGALSQANAGRGAWDGGWRVAGGDGGEAIDVARPDGLALRAPAAQVRAAGATAEGATVSVQLPKELRGWRPGFYVALGDSGAPAAGARTALYWNVAAAGAATLVARVTYALNGAGLPFALELRDNPARYGLGDAAVLTVGRTDGAAAIGLLRPLRRTLGAHLADAAPAFTKPLARGLAVAEPPAGGGRFGEHRCRLLAAALVLADAAGAHTVAERAAAVREHWAACGVRLDAPYLEPGSDDAYS